MTFICDTISAPTFQSDSGSIRLLHSAPFSLYSWSIFSNMAFKKYSQIHMDITLWAGVLQPLILSVHTTIKNKPFSQLPARPYTIQ